MAGNDDSTTRQVKEVKKEEFYKEQTEKWREEKQQQQRGIGGGGGRGGGSVTERHSIRGLARLILWLANLRLFGSRSSTVDLQRYHVVCPMNS